MRDLNKVLEQEPGNSLTLYNRGLIRAQLGAYEEALDDLDRVLNINPDNVLAHFNRASIFVELGLYQNAIEDYDKAIELYPDFAKAYMNRSVVKHMMGQYKASKKDYDEAMKKVREYRAKNMSEDDISLADTTRKYSSLLALDAEFAKKDFNDELLQHRDIDVRLRPLYRFVLTGQKDDVSYALEHNYENPLLARFEASMPVGVEVLTKSIELSEAALKEVEQAVWKTSQSPSSQEVFLRGLYDNEQNMFNSAQNYYSEAVDVADNTAGVDGLYKAFYLMNRGVLRAEMIEFIASIESNVQVLSMDDSGNTRARVKDQVYRQYDYTDAIQDMKDASSVVSDIPYIYYNLGNLYCLAAEHIHSLENYTKAIELYPYMGDAYFNRGLVLIYLKDKEKGCIDLSRAGELGVQDAYSVIKKYCEDEK
jgi:tetratricopeptide (TPR) repeat protein